MIEIRTDGEALDLPKGFSMEIEDSNPILNERGSQSLPATVPATRRNVRLLHAVHRIDSAFNPNFPEQKAVVSSGGFIRGGVLNVTEAGRNEGITFNVGFDNSTAYTEWSARKLSELKNLPVFVPAEAPSGTPVDLVLDELYRIYKTPRPRIDDFAVFPVALGKETNGSGASEKTYWEVLNAIGDHGLSQPGSVRRVLDGKVTDVTVPEAYCVSPFLRVWRVLELIFADSASGLSTILLRSTRSLRAWWCSITLRMCAASVNQLRRADAGLHGRGVHERSLGAFRSCLQYQLP